MRLSANKKAIIRELKNEFKAQSQVDAVSHMPTSNRYRLFSLMEEQGLLESKDEIISTVYMNEFTRKRIARLYRATPHAINLMKRFKDEKPNNKLTLDTNEFVEFLGGKPEHLSPRDFRVQKEYVLNNIFRAKPRGYIDVAGGKLYVYDPLAPSRFIRQDMAEMLAAKDESNSNNYVMIKFYQFCIHKFKQLTN